MNPEIVINSTPLDLELTDFLGQKPSDFLVLCFNGKELDFFGTPYDSPTSRDTRQALVDSLNDKTKKSLWPEMFSNWKTEICKQFGLKPETTAKDFHPEVSYKISRVCHGYSQYDHCAIGLFDTLSWKIAAWEISKLKDGEIVVQIIARDGQGFSKTGNKLPLVISETVLMLLKAHPSAP